MNDNNLQDVVNRISAEQADIVVLDGDIVDENTTSEQMQFDLRIWRLTVHMAFIMFMETMSKNRYMLQSRIIAQKKWKIRLHRREFRFWKMKQLSLIRKSH